MTFDEWFSEMEGFSMRGERIMEMSCMDALRATWEAAQAQCRMDFLQTQIRSDAQAHISQIRIGFGGAE